MEQLPRRKNTLRRRRSSLRICAVVIMVLIVIGAACGVKLVYDKGKDEGMQVQRQATEQNLKGLAEAVTKKVEMVGKMEELSKELPEEIDAEGIGSYINKLERLKAEVQDEEVKSFLTEYQQAWASFEETYKSENNKEIESAFSELRVKATETGEKMTNYYDELVKKEIDDLQK